MDYQFYAQEQGKIKVKCSMEHQAIAHWLNTEIDSQATQLNKVITALYQALEHKDLNYEDILEGNEYSLYLRHDEAIIKANNLNIETDDDFEYGFDYYQAESIALCGLEDLLQCLLKYQAFLSTN